MTLVKRTTFRYTHGFNDEYVCRTVSNGDSGEPLRIKLSGTELIIAPRDRTSSFKRRTLSLVGGSEWSLGDARVDKSRFIFSLVSSRRRGFFHTDRVVLAFDNVDEGQRWWRVCQKLFEVSFEKHYNWVKGGPIGQGSFAAVYIAADRSTGEEVAVKVVKNPPASRTRTLSKRDDARRREFVRRELYILRRIKHPNIVRTHDIFNDDKDVKVVMEFCKGHLFNTLAQQNRLSEAQAASIMRDILSAVAYLHAQGVVHRDIKPDNILTTSKQWPMQAKLADFGLSNYTDLKTAKDDTLLSSMVGTPLYAAPELLSGRNYGRPVDVWSCGVLLYVILSGRNPFDAATLTELKKLLKKTDVAFPLQQWATISEDAKRLVRGMLQRDPNKRLSALGALSHEWIQKEQAHDDIGNDLTDLELVKVAWKKMVLGVTAMNRLRSHNSLSEAAAPPVDLNSMSITDVL